MWKTIKCPYCFSFSEFAKREALQGRTFIPDECEFCHGTDQFKAFYPQHKRRKEMSGTEWLEADSNSEWRQNYLYDDRGTSKDRDEG